MATVQQPLDDHHVGVATTTTSSSSSPDATNLILAITIPQQPSSPLSESGEPVTHIKGLEYYPLFFSSQEQEQLLQLIDGQPWQTGVIARRQQFYGEIYYHTSFQSSKLQPTTANGNNDNCGDYDATSSASPPLFPATEQKQQEGISLQSSGMQYWLERTRCFFPDTLPTQVLVNEYRNNLGIASHFEDFEAFGDVIVTISLVNPVYMTLKMPTERTNACDTYNDVVKILLEPGSLLVMRQDARFHYRHGIGKSKWVHVPASAAGGPLSIKRDDSYRRISLTIRHLLKTRRQVSRQEDEQNTIKDPSVY
jgi:alkylated DNA repair dioxygenase AlkB